MEGGVGIILLLVIVVAVAGIGIAMYVTGGAILGGGGADDDGEPGPRPDHKRPTGPVQENVELAGTGGPRERERER